MRQFRPILVAAFFTILAAVPVSANHPGENLDERLAEREPYFQSIDRPAPSFRLAAADGTPVSLADFADKIVVLHFIYAGCPDICPLHAEKIAEIQELIEATPMKELVQFITITTDPANDTKEVLNAYGPDHGLESSNWKFLTINDGQEEARTRALAAEFGHKFKPLDDGLQAHGVVTHVIDQGGRWAANLYGLKFEPVNLVLYVNGLINNAQPHSEPDFWDRLWKLF